MDTATKKSRWFRFSAPEADLPELDQLFDFYWSGPERRISTLTLRIIGVNAIAMILLVIGILSLSEYHENLIDAKLETFNTEIQLISEVVSEVSVEGAGLNIEKTQSLVRRLAESTLPQRIQVFDRTGKLVVDSESLEVPSYLTPSLDNRDTLYSVEILKNMAAFVIRALPNKRALPIYPSQTEQNARAAYYPDAGDALEGRYSLSAWNDQNQQIFLSGAGPLYKDGMLAGAVLLTRSARDINEDIGDVWLNIVAAFFMTLIMTVLLSIYLAGVISNPLKKLARAAEGVRKGKLSYEDIPDFSSRNDEIGELSVAFREMMDALWSRMDSIDRFAADVAHELKNPLTSLKSAIETASIVKKKKDREKLMEIIRHDIDRLDRLITDISHASRLDSELSRDVYSRVNVHNVLLNLLAVYQDPLSREKGIVESVEFDGVRIRLQVAQAAGAYIWGMESRLEQVFQNLLANALSFSEEGCLILVKLQVNKSAVHVVFEDEGPGIPEKNLDTVFERFYTQRPSHEGYGQHSGLGLSICRQIITAMGGDIYAENIKDEKGATMGARFSVVLKKN